MRPLEVVAIPTVTDAAILLGLASSVIGEADDGGESFTPGQIKSLEVVGNMVRRNGGRWYLHKSSVVEFLNKTTLVEGK